MSALPVPRAAYKLASAAAARVTPRRAIFRTAASRAPSITTAASSTPEITTSTSTTETATSTTTATTPDNTAGDETYLEAATRPSRFEESCWGPEDVSEVLLQAMRIQWSHGYPHTPRGYPRLTHGFHEYPAGMQAAAADRILDVMPGDSVLDPFMVRGGGGGGGWGEEGKLKRVTRHSVSIRPAI